MKILLAESMSYFGLGGAPKANRALIEGLAQRGHSCSVISVEDRQDSAANGSRYDDTRDVKCGENGIKVLSATTDLDQSALLRKYLRERKPDWTLISENGVLLLDTALEIDPSHVVLIAHGIITNLATSGAAATKKALHALLVRAAGIITVSNYMREYIREWSGLDSKVIHFPSYGTGPFPRFYNFENGYVTMINPCGIKGISVFVALAQNLPEVRFAAVPTWGTGTEDRAALARLSNVRILKQSPNVDDIFACTKVLLVPSLGGEAFGQIVVEAMLRGIPVLASNAGGLPEAKLGVDYVLPVNIIERYEMDAERRVNPVIPIQKVRPWMAPLQRLLTDRAHYEHLSAVSREAARSFVAGLGPLPFEQYLQQLAPATHEPLCSAQK